MVGRGIHVACMFEGHQHREGFLLFSPKSPSNRAAAKCREPEVQFRGRRRLRSPNLETLVPA